MSTLTQNGEKQRDRLAMHIGLMVALLQRGAPLTLVQSQCISLRKMLKQIIDLEEEDGDAWMQVTQLLPDEVAELLLEGRDAVPDDLSCLDDDGEEKP